jgi:hypothetical protein
LIWNKARLGAAAMDGGDRNGVILSLIDVRPAAILAKTFK